MSAQRSVISRRVIRIAAMTAAAALLLPAVGSTRAYTLVVFHPGPHMIDEIDPTSGKILRQLPVEDQPHEAVITADGKTIFASIPAAGVVVVIDAATLTQKSRIESEAFKAPPHPQGRKGQMTTSASPHAIALGNDGTKLYVGLSWREHPAVVVYDTKAGKTLKRIDLPASGEFMRVHPETGRLFVPTREGLVVIDTKKDEIEKSIPIAGNPVGVDFGRTGEIWTSENGDGTVTVIDDKLEPVKTIQTEGKGAGRMALSSDGKWAAATHEGTEDVVLFNVAKREAVATINVGKGASLPIFSPDSTRLYVMTAGGPCSESCPGNVVVIEVSNAKLLTRYKVADDAFAAVIRLSDGK